MSCLDTERRLKSRRRRSGVRVGGTCSNPFLVQPKTEMLFFAELRCFDSRGVLRSDEPFLPGATKKCSAYRAQGGGFPTAVRKFTGERFTPSYDFPTQKFDS
eukprot:6661587-Prymnesium_polylepis.1